MYILNKLIKIVKTVSDNIKGIKNKISDLFNLGEHPNLFELALKPRSCGGEADFEQLALLGDKILDIHIIELLISRGFESTGAITQEADEFHNKNVLLLICRRLQIDQLMIPEEGESVGTKDKAEVVEALLGANYKAYGADDSKPIVAKLYSIFEQLIDSGALKSSEIENHKGALFEIFQQSGEGPPVDIIEAKRVGGEDHLPDWQSEFSIEFKGIIYHIQGTVSSNKTKAEQDAARLLIEKITHDIIKSGNKELTR